MARIDGNWAALMGVLALASLITSLHIEAYEWIALLPAGFIPILATLPFVSKEIRSKYIELSGTSFLATSIAGLLLVKHHLVYYGGYFDAWVDDLNYYEASLSITRGDNSSAYSVYEYFLACQMYIFMHISEITPIVALWVNWVATGITIGTIYLITRFITSEEPSRPIILLVVLGNYVFLQNSAHLYRDIFVVLFFLACIYFALQHKYILLVVAFLLLTALRLPSALVCLPFIYICIDKVKKNYLKKYIFLAGVTSGVALIYFTGLEYLPGKSLDIFDEYLKSRVESYSDSISDTAGGGAIAHKLPFPFNIPAVLLFQIFSPIRILNIFQPDGVYYFTVGSMISHKAIGYSITAILWIPIGPLLILGFHSALKNEKFIRRFFYLFICLCLILGFASFQERHKMIMIALFPVFIHLGIYEFKKNNISTWTTSVGFISFWVAINSL